MSLVAPCRVMPLFSSSASSSTLDASTLLSCVKTSNSNTVPLLSLRVRTKVFLFSVVLNSDACIVLIVDAALYTCKIRQNCYCAKYFKGNKMEILG